MGEDTPQATATPVFEQNLQALGTRYPEIIEEIRSHMGGSLDPEAGFDQNSLVRSYGDGDRGAILAQWLAGCDPRGKHLYVTAGLGDGSHIRALLGHLPPGSRVCILEAEVGALVGALRHFRMVDLILNPRTIWVTPFSWRGIVIRLNVELAGIEASSVFLFRPLYERAESLYRNLLESLMRQLTIRWNQIRTDLRNTEVVFENSLRNFRELGWTSNLVGFHRLFEEAAMVLVAAGPSLDSSFEFLRQVQDKALVVVVNSAYRAVSRQGIRPHVTVAADPRSDTDRGYGDCSTEGVMLFCPYIVYPEVPRRFAGRTLALSSFNQLIGSFRKVLNLPDEPPVVGDGTVSATVINLAGLFGCSQVILVGQDLALSREGRTHTKDSFYTDDNRNCFSMEGCEWVPGNDGEPVPTEPKLRAYQRIFENLVSHYADIRFYNMSKAGARVHGAPLISIGEALQVVEGARRYAFREELHRRLEETRFPGNANTAGLILVGKYRDYLEVVLDRVIRLGIQAELVPESGEWVMGEEPFASSSLGEARREILDLLNGQPFFANLLFEGRARRLYHDFIAKHHDWALLSDVEARFSQAHPQLWALADGCAWQLDTIRSCGYPLEFPG